MHVHLIGVAGTGMGAFAGLLKSAGHRVTGSDTAFYPPMGDALRAWGIETCAGFDPAHLEPAPDLVVVGNVCRRENPEARAAIDRGLPYRSFPRALAETFLEGRQPLVVAGTHGKTTTSALLAFLLSQAGREPSFLVGGVPLNFPESFHLGQGRMFVLEGDEYDSAFFEKVPKFWSYRPWGALITSIEHDHVDIYPTMESYREAFRGFVARVAPGGLLVAHAPDAEVSAATADAPCRVVRYGLTTDLHGDTPAAEWQAHPMTPEVHGQPFDLLHRGEVLGRFTCPLMGEHNLRNALGALALASESAGLAPSDLAGFLPEFRGVRRRQDLVGEVRGVRIYDDFAHHPTAVAETLRALRRHHARGRLVAVFEPRSATACRRTHQDDYPAAFAAADLSIVAPVGRPEIPGAERLDVPRLVAAIRASGRRAETVPSGPTSVDAIVDLVVREVAEGDLVAVLSNGAFGGILEKLRAGLGASPAPDG